jgi:uncharacterized protein (TIGR00369 family)
MREAVHRVRNLNFAEEIAASFARQGALRTIGAELDHIAPGLCRVRLPVSDAVSQHLGFVHGGILGMLADVAGCYAAMSLFDPGHEVLTIEYKINFLAPARGREVLAVGRIVRAGRRMSVAAADIFALEGDVRLACAVAQLTCMPAP